MQVYQPQQQELRCPTCQIHFNDIIIHKQHYKSDHHRYNLKRKMVKLPPITLTMFQQKIVDKPKQVSNKYQCGQCRKQFASAGTLKQHAQSKKHDPTASNQSQKISHGEKPQPKPFVKDAKRCLFCGVENISIEQNQSHMSTVHSFFIAQRQYCREVQGLLQYLQEKIEVGNMCLTCQNKGAHDFQSTQAVRMHMADRGHNFMKTDTGFEQYEKYYDFSSLFEAKLLEQQNIVPGIEFQEVKVLVDENESDGEWEDIEDERQEGSKEGEEEEEWEQIQEETGQQEGEEKEEQSRAGKQKVKTYRIMKPTMTSNDQLLLPNGKTLGHRKYRQFYKQTIRLQPWYSQLQQLGYGMPGTSNALVDRNSLSRLVKQEQMWKRSLVRQRKNALRVGMNNNGLMKYFRCQNSL